jgi:hypothetical protein
METTRRSFLKAGLLGAALLAGGGGIYRRAHPPQPQTFLLDGEARAVLNAIACARAAGKSSTPPHWTPTARWTPT